MGRQLGGALQGTGRAAQRPEGAGPDCCWQWAATSQRIWRGCMLSAQSHLPQVLFSGAYWNGGTSDLQHQPQEEHHFAIRSTSLSAPSLLLTFLPGCTQLRDVLVQFETPPEGASVKIRCHCDSECCILPFVGHAELFDDELPWDMPAGLEEVGVRLLPTPASTQAVQPYRVLFTWHAAGPEQAPKWGHVIMPGVL